MITSESKIQVRYSETDMMGIVYHANYLPWLEIGRTNLLKENGLSYSEMEQSGILLPVVEIHVNYRRPATYDDEISIKTMIQERSLARVRLDYELRKDEEVIATGHSVHAFMNRSGQPIKAPRRFLEMFNSAFE